MSIESVVSRVGEILAMQRQLSDPAGVTGGAAVSPTTSLGTTSISGTAVAPNFSSALTSALGTINTQQGVSSDARVQAMVNMASSLVGKPYVWGGGHGGFGPSSGYDCSGFVSAVLHAGGYLSAPADTTSLPSQPGILPGPGRYVTIYDRAQSGSSGHVIIEINGEFYESGGAAGAWGGGGGVQHIGRPSDSYLSTFETVLHPDGL